MKILHLITGLKFGGAEYALFNFLTKIHDNPHKYNYEHHVVYFHHGPIVDRINTLGIKTYHLKGLLSPYDPIGLLCLRKIIKSISPQIIHSALWSANVLGRLYAKKYNIPIICDLHGHSTHEGFLRNILDRATSHIPAKIIAVSSQIKKTYQTHISKTAQIEVIKNGIDSISLIQKANANPLSRDNIGLPNNSFVIGTVGRLESIKSYDLLLQAFALAHKESNNQKSPLSLCIVGDGSQKKYLEALAKKLEIHRDTYFMGSRDDAYKFYSLFDCFALSSQSEGLSIALLEAISFGLPIITTNNEAEHEVLTDGLHGFIITGSNKQKILQIAQAIKTLSSNSTLCNNIKYNNQQLATFYSLDRTVNHYYEIYRIVAGCH